MFATRAVATCPCQLEVIQCGFHLLDKNGTAYHITQEEQCRVDLGTAFALALSEDGHLELYQGPSADIRTMFKLRRFSWDQK